ncbi:uncharacterized protein [Diadema setosum]|uniref:uncharacterized protein n=1 Tax=Diadema setosum TaxID=31175 RepID=UPI003B3ADC25
MATLTIPTTTVVYHECDKFLAVGEDIEPIITLTPNGGSPMTSESIPVLQGSRNSVLMSFSSRDTSRPIAARVYAITVFTNRQPSRLRQIELTDMTTVDGREVPDSITVRGDVTSSFVLDEQYNTLQMTSLVINFDVMDATRAAIHVKGCVTIAPTAPTTAATTPVPSTTAPICYMVGSRICGTEIVGVDMYSTNTMPTGQVVPSPEGVAVAQAASTFTVEFSTTVSVGSVLLHVLQDLQAQEAVGFELHYKQDMGNWRPVMNSTTGEVIEFPIPADTRAGDTLEVNVSNVLPPDITDAKIRFTTSSQYRNFTLRPTFDYCVTIDQCVPRKRGCEVNGKFYLLCKWKSVSAVITTISRKCISEEAALCG